MYAVAISEPFAASILCVQHVCARPHTCQVSTRRSSRLCARCAAVQAQPGTACKRPPLRRCAQGARLALHVRAGRVRRLIGSYTGCMSKLAKSDDIFWSSATASGDVMYVVDRTLHLIDVVWYTRGPSAAPRRVALGGRDSSECPLSQAHAKPPANQA